MSAYRQIVIENNGRILAKRAKWCNTFLTKLRGFTFRRTLAADDALVRVYGADSSINSAIHMFFVPFDLGVIWVNDAGEVVDTVVAKSWRPSYAPQAPARYIIELHPDLLPQVQVGDRIRFAEAS